MLTVLMVFLVYKVDSSEAETTEDENVTGGSARNSFSQALKGNRILYIVSRQVCLIYCVLS